MNHTDWDYRNGGFVNKNEFYNYLMDSLGLSREDIENELGEFTNSELERYSRQFID
jgi:hypothetical protein